MHAAIFLKKNGVVCKTNNIEKKLKKEKDEINILEQWEFDNDLNKIDERFKYWNSQYSNKKSEDDEEVLKFYYFRNIKNGLRRMSIYSDLNHIPDNNPEDWVPITEEDWKR